jgi:hypothetical protein
VRRSEESRPRESATTRCWRRRFGNAGHVAGKDKADMVPIDVKQHADVSLVQEAAQRLK